jgi:hypothetical protein
LEENLWRRFRERNGEFHLNTQLQIWLKGKKCDNCGIQADMVIGREEHLLCQNCFNKWGKFLKDYNRELEKVSGTPMWSIIWEEVYAKFLSKAKERVNFT